MGDYIALNRLDEAKATTKEAQARGLDFPNLHSALYDIGFLERDSSVMEREADILMSRRGYQSRTLYLESETAAYGGQMSRARELTKGAIAESQRNAYKEAVARFLVQAGPIGALARLGFGRAYAITGDAAKAKTAYQDFFALWKDADPDVPILKQARVEYAKLQ